MPEDSITPAAERFLRPPRLADQPAADRLDLLIELTQTTNRLLAKLVEQGGRHPLDPPPVPFAGEGDVVFEPRAEILPVDPPSAKRARAGKPAPRKLP